MGRAGIIKPPKTPNTHCSTSHDTSHDTDHLYQLHDCVLAPSPPSLPFPPSLPTLPPSEWGLSESHISEHEQSIGRGEFGEVKTGTYRNTQVNNPQYHSAHDHVISPCMVCLPLSSSFSSVCVCVCVYVCMCVCVCVCVYVCMCVCVCV